MGLELALRDVRARLARIEAQLAKDGPPGP
jgi:hypothetical protein